jgi:hypothetical protein
MSPELVASLTFCAMAAPPTVNATRAVSNVNKDFKAQTPGKRVSCGIPLAYAAMGQQGAQGLRV